MADYNSSLDRRDRGGSGGGTMDAGITDRWLSQPIKTACYQLQERGLDPRYEREAFISSVLTAIEIQRETDPKQYREQVSRLIDAFLANPEHFS